MAFKHLALLVCGRECVGVCFVCAQTLRPATNVFKSTPLSTQSVKLKAIVLSRFDRET